MEVIKIIREADIGEDFPSPLSYTKRITARAIVFDTDGNMALLNVTHKGHHKLPGGGIEEGESIEGALVRELVEEIGCQVMNVCELGIIEEYRNKTGKHQVSYCFIADVLGVKGLPNLDEDEIADGSETVWTPLEQAIKILENEMTSIDSYGGKFINLRELSFLKEAYTSLR